MNMPVKAVICLLFFFLSLKRWSFSITLFEVNRMDEKIMKLLKEIKKDCIDLEKCSDSTEYGKGQHILINLILAELE